MTQTEPMLPEVDTRNAAAVAREVRRLFRSLFPGDDDYFLTRAFDWAMACFEGRCRPYGAIDAPYHDLEHTLQGTLCFTRLLHGRHLVGHRPLLTRKAFELGLLAILFHDSGYLKRVEDTQGSGAKYTHIHVRRGTDFVREFLSQHNYTPMDIASIEQMIRCTGVNADMDALAFPSELEKIVGYVVGTADLIAQMAAPDYVDKLPLLFEEMAEARGFAVGAGEESPQFHCADDLIQNTPAFWREYVWPKINTDFGGVFRYLSDPYPDGPNEYIQAALQNIARIEHASGPRVSGPQQCARSSTQSVYEHRLS